MSRFNRKGYRTLVARTPQGELQPVPVKVGGKLHGQHESAIRKAKKERQQAFRDYKAKLRDQKKQVPIEQRSQVNWSRVPERYL